MRIAASHLWRNGFRIGEFAAGTKSGLLIGVFWIALVAGGNLGAGGFVIWFGASALLIPVVTSMVIAEKTGSVRSALQMQLRSGLVSGAMCFVGFLVFAALFLNPMMRDPANLRDFVRHAGHSPSRAELSHFLYLDALGGGLNMLWISPLLTVLLGASGAAFGKALSRGDEKQKLL